jgi:preprotein translocase subunit YajC
MNISNFFLIAVVAFLAVAVMFLMWRAERKERKDFEQLAEFYKSNYETVNKHYEELQRINARKAEVEKAINGATTDEENINIFNYIRTLNNNRVQDNADGRNGKRKGGSDSDETPKRNH